MIKVSNIACPLDLHEVARGGFDQTEGPLVKLVARALGVRAQDIVCVRVLRRSIDARKKTNVHFIVSAAVKLCDETQERQSLEAGKAQPYAPYRPLDIPLCDTPQQREAAVHGVVPAPVVMGAGPAGLFAALYLARAGLRPLLVEQGPCVQDRARAVDAFDAGGDLAPFANVQFGEGGAGTFSDGKLTTNTKHPMAPHVLQWFVDAGAPEDILWDAKPHIGSDKLPDVVMSLRQEVVALGGTVLFDTRIADMTLVGGRLAAVETENVLTGEVQRHAARQLVVACGHSARDTFELLMSHDVPMERKPFAIGVRIEHLQADINRAQWGSAAAHPGLGAADYKLAVHVSKQRSAYTFCMCPGGTVTCAASERGGVVTNGMSNYARDGRNANAALLVNVDPDDFGADDALAGVRFQQKIERRAFNVAHAAGGAAYQAPAQTVGDFLGMRGAQAKHAVEPTYARGCVWCDLREVLPDFVCETIAAALPKMDDKLHGFANPTAVMTAPETRSSSPVRIQRDAGLQALVGGTPSGIYPCGEGAGYAGGIMSAASDGLRVAVNVARDWSQNSN